MNTHSTLMSIMNNNENKPQEKKIIEYLEKQLERTATWLSFAEAKNAALIALNVALIAVTINLFSTSPVLTVLTIITTVVSSILCLLSFFPNLSSKANNSGNTNYGKHPNLVYFKDIAECQSSQEYVDLLQSEYFHSNNCVTKQIQDLAEEVLINSKITVEKYRWFAWAMKADIASFVLLVVMLIVA